MSDRLLMKGGTVLSLDRSVGNADGIDVLVEGGLIAEVGPNLRARGAEIVDAERCIVMPGLVDAHRHAWHALLSNTGAGDSDSAAVASRLTDEHVHAGTLVALLSAAASGTTTVVDWFDLDASRVPAAIDAHTTSGLRTVLVVGGPASSVAGLEPGPRTNIAWGSPPPDGSSVDEIRTGWETARAAGLRIHAHVGMRRGAGGVVAALGAAGLLGPDVTLVHCTHLSDDDLGAIADSGTKVVLTPVVEMTSGIGIPPIQGFVDRKIPLGLGIESEREAPGDVLAQMRAANSVQHATLFDLKLAGKGGVPNLLGTREVIRYGTVDGAGAAGLGEVVGTITPGMAADMVVFRADRPNIAPVNDPIGAVVWGMDLSNVDTVIVGGDVLVRAGRVVADIGAAVDSVRRAAAEFSPLARSGMA